MALASSNKYINAQVEDPGVDVTKNYVFHPGSLETVTIHTGAYTQTVGAVGSRELRPYSLITLAVTGGQFTSDATITIDGTNHQAGDIVEFVFTPSDIPSPRTLTIKDSAATPNTLATLSATSDSGLSTATRKFVLGTAGTWTSVKQIRSASLGFTKTLTGSKTWDPASITAPNTTSTTVTVTGAVVGDFVIATLSTQGTSAQLTAYVSGNDTVTVVLGAFTGTVDVASGTLSAIVLQAS